MSLDISQTNTDQQNDEINEKKCQLEGTRLHLNPEADVADLFKSFNEKFFWNKLEYVEVRWSPRMTLCAGLCVYHRRPGYCSVRLSRPLLSLRGKVDLVETLLHEMIHAFLFVTENNKDRDGHGPEFLKHMDRINKEAGLNISVYHTFREEVRHYQQHVWLCDGPCQQRHPYYGKVHRAINRDPGPTDLWWWDHQRDCGGSFTKISQPEGYQSNKKKISSKKKDSSESKTKDIRSFFKPVHQKSTNTSDKNHLRYTLPIKGSTHEMGKRNATNRDETMNNSNIHDQSKQNSPVGDFTPKDNLNTHSPNERDFDKDMSEGDSTSSCDEGVLGIFGTIFSLPFRFLKRRAEDSDPSTIKIRKPNLGAQPKSKKGMLKNLIKVPDQPTLDAFYQKKRSAVSNKKIPTSESASKSSQSKKGTLMQPSVQSFFNGPANS